MSLQPIFILLKNFSAGFPKNKKIEEYAVQIIKTHGIPPAVFRVSCKNKTLRIFSTNPNVSSELFLYQQDIVSKLKEKFGDTRIIIHTT